MKINISRTFDVDVNDILLAIAKEFEFDGFNYSILDENNEHNFKHHKGIFIASHDGTSDIHFELETIEPIRVRAYELLIELKLLFQDWKECKNNRGWDIATDVMSIPDQIRQNSESLRKILKD